MQLERISHQSKLTVVDAGRSRLTKPWKVTDVPHL